MKSTFQFFIVSIIFSNIILLYNCEKIKKEFKILKCYQNKISTTTEFKEFEEQSIIEEVKTSIDKLALSTKSIFDSTVQEIKHIADTTHPKESIKDPHVFKLLTEGIEKVIKAQVQKQDLFFESKLDFIDVPLSKAEATFKVFSPDNFSSFRTIYNIDQDLKKSFSDLAPFELQDTGNSDTKIFHTADHKFIIKTINNSEQQVLTSILSEYFSHFCENSKSLLPKISGLYYFKFNYVQHFVIIMPNIYPYPLQRKINKQYFLKGVDKEALLKEDKGDQRFRLLELNFFDKYPNGFTVPSNIHTSLKGIIQKDCEFLRKIEVTNYSLAIILSPIEKPVINRYRPGRVNNFFQQTIEKNDFIVNDGNKNVHVFIVFHDVLHKYNNLRKIESISKSILLGKGDKTIILDPEKYANRFINFITGHVFVQIPTN